MSLFIRLFTVAAIAVLLRCVPATLVITAPSKVTDSTAGLETREQGPTAWICSVLAVDSPWNAYANIRGYLEGGNAEKKDFSNLVLYPVMELFHARESRLCVYLPAEDHCYPPAPSTSQVKAVKQLSTKNYYAIRFWGQASDARVQYYKQKLTAALNTQSKAANFDLFFVSFFSDHVREVRYDPATKGQEKILEPLQITQRQPGTCPAGLGFNDSSTTMQFAGQEYLRSSLAESRLSLSDVQTKVVSGSDVQSLDACAKAASIGGQTAFSFVGGVCKVYNLGKHFCSCATGAFDIYINKKQLGELKELIGEELAPKGFKKLVIYTEIHPDNSVLSFEPPMGRSQCTAMLPGLPIHSGAVLAKDQCYVTIVTDFPNCNQTCRGQPMDVLVTASNQSLQNQPFLSLCGQNISVLKNGGNRNHLSYVSHAGFGCYRYQGVKTVGGEDCIVTFERGPNVTALSIHTMAIGLNSEGSTCLDEFSIYDGKSTAVTSRKYNGCSKLPPYIYVKGDITVKFHRKLGGENNIGFKISVGPM